MRGQSGAVVPFPVDDDLSPDIVETLGRALGEALAARFLAENTAKGADMGKSRSDSNQTQEDD